MPLEHHLELDLELSLLLDDIALNRYSSLLFNPHKLQFPCRIGVSSGFCYCHLQMFTPGDTIFLLLHSCLFVLHVYHHSLQVWIVTMVADNFWHIIPFHASMFPYISETFIVTCYHRILWYISVNYTFCFTSLMVLQATAW
jgi:hypothetical protein